MYYDLFLDGIFIWYNMDRNDFKIVINDTLRIHLRFSLKVEISVLQTRS